MDDIDRRFLATLNDLQSRGMVEEATVILEVVGELAEIISSAGDSIPSTSEIVAQVAR
ncbi:hypothetical protein [Acuticoccus mangrovi]|uniref:Uncharacterized protein n=1 Tax=Acuticoccus mangrovi TaxID=2796142 RepID=A0A934MHA6_9HYPH|nr:hypothetical protein [Acuticoccus mangrovi]MBJ3775856.1 hypothetical protein [Acuticoccus mangrovi]